MIQYNQNKEKKNMRIAAATNMQTEEHIVPIKENVQSKKIKLNPDDFLDED